MTLDELIATFRQFMWLPDPTPLLVVLATVVANHLDGDAVWLLLVGPPSSGKTELLNALSDMPNIHEVSTFTTAGLLSGSISRRPNATGGLLAEVGAFGIVACKDFTSLLSESSETRASVLAALREIYDGQWSRRLGSGGGMTLAWSGKVGLIAAVTETIDRHLAAIGAMGERFVFCRMPTLTDEDRLAQADIALTTVGTEAAARRRATESVRSFLTPILERPGPELGIDPTWLGQLADLATRCRSVVERDPRDREIELVPQPEATPRLTKVLAQLGRGLMAIGVSTAAVCRILTDIALAGLPKMRRAVVEDLATSTPRGTLTAAEVADRIGMPTEPVYRALTELAAHGVAERHSIPNGAHRWGPSEWLNERWNDLQFDNQLAKRLPDVEPFLP